MISLLPSRVIKLLEFIGFSGSKVRCILNNKSMLGLADECIQTNYVNPSGL